MLNLLGCNKQNFINLLKNMSYKIIEKDEEIFFKYNPIKKKKNFIKKLLKKKIHLMF